MFFLLKIGKDQKLKLPFYLRLIKNYFSKEIKSVISQGIKINILGELKKLSPELRKVLKKSSTNKKK